MQWIVKDLEVQEQDNMSKFIQLNVNNILTGFYSINECGDIISKKSKNIKVGNI